MSRWPVGARGTETSTLKSDGLWRGYSLQRAQRPTSICRATTTLRRKINPEEVQVDREYCFWDEQVEDHCSQLKPKDFAAWLIW